MKPIEEYFVPWIRGQKMYVSNHLELAWRDRSLHRMMSNENPLEPSPKVLAAINEYARVANRYPDQGLVVRRKIAEINGFDGPEHVMIGNGSSEVFDVIFRSFLLPGQEVIQHTPCFAIYKLRCAALGGKLVSVPMKYDLEARQILFDADAVLAAITPNTRVIAIANPNNPTGNFMADADFVRIAETGIPFVVDEAYIDFAGLEWSQMKLVRRYPNVLITRTLSKAYGLAGLRFGYALGNKDVIAQISAALVIWNVGTIPMWAALAALEDTEGLQQRVEFVNRSVQYIETELQDVPGLTIFHSRASYILFDGTDAGKKGQDMVDYALSRGVLFRPQAEMYGRDGFFRVTVGTEEENQLAVQIIKDFFAS